MFSSEAQILLTLAYADQFSWPLSLKEINTRLINKSSDDLQKSLNNLLALKLISISPRLTNLGLENNGFYCLKNSQANFQIRKEREKYSQAKWLEAKEFIKLVKNLPAVKAVFVTGSLAVNNSKENDDIDFLIITSKNSLWLLRPLIILLALVRGKARLRKFHADNTWCFNMWLSEDALQMPNKNRSVYTAYEICQAVCILNKNNINKKFLEENKWVENYLPEFYQSVTPAQAGVHTAKGQFVGIKQFADFILWIPAYAGMTAVAVLNALAFLAQRLYMSTHMSGKEKVSLSRAFFHPRDTKNIIFKKWQDSLKNLSP